MIAQTALVDLNKWRKEQKKEIARKEKLLADQMKAAVPENLAKWLEADGNETIKMLIEKGSAVHFYHHTSKINDSRIYGYSSLKEFAQRFEQLKINWNNSVGIYPVLEGEEILKVSFKAF